MRSILSRVRGHLAFVRLLRDPTRLDQVFEVDASIPDLARTLNQLVEVMRAHPPAAAALAERPRLAIDLHELRALPRGTLGRAVADFLDRNRLDPRALSTLDGSDEAAWARAHLYETHDVWHVATGFSTDIAGELGLEAFYAAQLPVRLPHYLLAGGLLQSLIWAPDDFRARLAAIARGWDAGTRARPLFGVRWDRSWSLPLTQVRAELQLP
jgi:ubiquinone biosynthesis protein COQ4